MDDLFFNLEVPYIDSAALLALLQNYKRPRDRIERLARNGQLIRLKNGFFLIAGKLYQPGSSGRHIPYEQIANLLFGPSYVSLEWALSFYGMIPERVHTITSMALGKKRKEYRTPVGDFVYAPLHAKQYSVGILQKPATGAAGHFLMASPEKALADFVFVRCRGLKQEELEVDLRESHRIDLECCKNFDRCLLKAIAQASRSRSLAYLVNLVGVL